MKRLLFIAIFAMLWDFCKSPNLALADTGDIPLSSNFQENSARPLDSRAVVVDTPTLYGLSSILVYPGMTVYVKSTTQTYQLQGSTYNWVNITGGSSATIQNTSSLQ